MHQNLADLDALAAGAERVLHALAAADDGHAAQLLGEVNADVRVARLGHNTLLMEGQVAQAVLHHLSQSWHLMSLLISAVAAVQHHCAGTHVHAFQ